MKDIFPLEALFNPLRGRRGGGRNTPLQAQGLSPLPIMFAFEIIIKTSATWSSNSFKSIIFVVGTVA